MLRKPPVIRIAGVLLLLTIAIRYTWAGDSTGPTFRDLYLLAGPGSAWGPLVQAVDGNLYGVTGQYGYSHGNIYALGLQGSGLATIYSFCTLPNCADGSNPTTGLVQSPSGILYGTTQDGGWVTTGSGGQYGQGTIYGISAGGQFTLCHTFRGSDGAAPEGGLALDYAGYVYGTTRYGGVNCTDAQGCGTAFRMDPSGRFLWEHSFSGPDGSEPLGTLLLAANGSLYGTTNQGGAYNAGTIFRVTVSGEFSTLYNFCAQPGCADGSNPEGGLIQSVDGNLYGTTYTGGVSNLGTVFKITPDGELTTVYSFSGGDGQYPQGSLTQGSDRNLYGTTYSGGTGAGWGTMYQLTLSGQLTTIYSFQRLGDGGQPWGGLTQGVDGNFYGSAIAGGTGDGVLYEVTAGLPAQVQALPAGDVVGDGVAILGEGLDEATGVSFNGVTTTFNPVSPTQLDVTVPVGASTGYIEVTLPSGNVLENLPFRVRPKVQQITPTSGKAGTPVTVRGESFTGARTVAFGDGRVGTSSFTVDSDTRITVIVPEGVVSGRVSVSTKGGSGISSMSFEVE
jgi:uncharacterized repeat protein (TIGR03803 family)